MTQDLPSPCLAVLVALATGCPEPTPTFVDHATVCSWYDEVADTGDSGGAQDSGDSGATRTHTTSKYWCAARGENLPTTLDNNGAADRRISAPTPLGAPLPA